MFVVAIVGDAGDDGIAEMDSAAAAAAAADAAANDANGGDEFKSAGTTASVSSRPFNADELLLLLLLLLLLVSTETKAGVNFPSF